ncbi:MAG: hypothetical protein U1D55_00450 [Phycisphaerae bacterium]
MKSDLTQSRLVRVLMVFCAIAAIVAIAGRVNYYVDRNRRAATVTQGNELVSAINAYHTREGSFPTELERAVIGSIPPPTWGARAWGYQSDGEYFCLWVYSGDRLTPHYPMLIFDSRLGRWSFDE